MLASCLCLMVYLKLSKSIVDLTLLRSSFVSFFRVSFVFGTIGAVSLFVIRFMTSVFRC